MKVIAKNLLIEREESIIVIMAIDNILSKNAKN